MPIMWFAKDGSRPYSQTGPGIEITVAEAQAIVGSNQVKFVGTEVPSFNPRSPSNWVKNVIIEIESNTQLCQLFPMVGFYFIVGLNPEESTIKLNLIRKSN